MSKLSSNTAITIDSDLINDFHFLIIETKNVAKLLEEAVNSFSVSKIEQLKKRGAYLDSLKSRIVSLGYDSIFQLESHHKILVKNYRALIKVSVNVHRIGEFFIQAGAQLQFVRDSKQFKSYDLSEFFKVIKLQLNRIFTCFTEVDQKLAEKICESEVELDELYLKQFNFIQDNISKKERSHDLLTLLFIVRYFERIGDRLLIIGESVLNISVGETIDIKNYQNLQNAVQALVKKNEDIDYEFKPFLFSRSGCKVGRLLITRKKNDKKTVQRLFYKSGDSQKIVEEIIGLSLWAKHMPNTAPDIAWKSVKKNTSTLVVNYLKGDNFLSFLLNRTSDGDFKLAVKAIQEKLRVVWSVQKGKKPLKTDLIKQIKKRKDAILKVHQDFFDDFYLNSKKPINFNDLLSSAKKIEKKVKVPFSVLCHGDFNLDNILYDKEAHQVNFVDVHRSGFKDYAQELSVFIVSALRVKVEDDKTRKIIAWMCLEMFEFGKTYAKEQKDEYFEVRFGLGLFRSFITSTRFLFDDEWYHKMRLNAISVFEDLQLAKGDYKKVKINLGKVLK